MPITTGNKKIKIIFYLLIFIFLSTINPLNNYKISNEKNIFNLKEIQILGTDQINVSSLQSELEEKLLGKNFYSLSSKNIGEILNKNKLIKKFNINKQYPNKIIIKVEEATLLALFVKDKKKYFIADNYNLIPYSEDLANDAMPNVYGKNAENYFNDFIDVLKENDFNTKEITNYYFFQINRWDLVTSDQRTIKFPEKNLQQAIITVNKLLKDKNFDKYSVIDLRISDKIITQQ